MRNPADVAAQLREQVAEKDEYIEELEDKLDRLTGRLERAHAITEVDDIAGDEDQDDDASA
jgi:uncharacterized coiled-coil protein SlyX